MDKNAGAGYLSPELFSAEEWKALSHYFCLTNRQRDIAEWICRGESRRTIARILRIAAETVHTHTKELFRKTAAKNRVCFVVRLVVTNRDLRRSRHR